MKLMLKKMLLFLSFGLNYMNYCSILFLGVLDSCIICYCLILLVFLFVYLYLFGLNRGLKKLFGLFWLPKNPLLPRSGLNLNNFWELFSKLFLNWPWGKQSKYIIINRQKWKPLKDIQGIYIRPVSVILPLYPFFSTWRLPFVEAFLCSKFVCRKYEPDVIR